MFNRQIECMQSFSQGYWTNVQNVQTNKNMVTKW